LQKVSDELLVCVKQPESNWQRAVAAVALSLLLSPSAQAETFTINQTNNQILVADALPTLLPPINPSTQNQSSAGEVSLNQALNETFGLSPRAASVRLQLGIAKSAIPQALTFPNPSLIVYNGFIAEQTYQLGASIPIEQPWKVFFRLVSAKQQIKQADLEIQRNLWLLRSNVRRAFLEVVLAEEMAQTLAQVADLTNRLLLAAAKRANAGDVANLDVFKAKLAHSQAQVELAQAQRQVRLTKRRLNLLRGKDHAVELSVPRLPPFQLKVQKTELLPDFDQALPTLDQLIATAHQKRLDVRLVIQAIKTNEAELKSTYASILPNTQFNVGRSITGNPPDGPKLNGYFIGVTQELPVFDFKQADVTRYRSTLRQLKIEAEAQKNIVSEEVAVAYERVSIARERIQAYQDHLLADSEQVARLARRSYEVGQSDITAAIAAQQANIQVKTQYLEAVRSYQQAFTDLEQAVGEIL
jgi:outer membrane protein, heavy metal efflux system